jgi:hypothetical protein
MVAELVQMLQTYPKDTEVFISYGLIPLPLNAVWLFGEKKIIVNDHYPRV